MDAGLMAVPDGGCPALAQSYVATLITVPVSWPAPASGTSVAGTGNVQLVILSNETTSDAGAFSGTSRTCATTLPPVQIATSLNGLLSPPVPKTDTAYLEISLPDSLWDKISRTSTISGSSTGWSPGSTVVTSASTALFGVSDTSMFANPATAWPAPCMTNCVPTGPFAATDLTANDGDDDGDGHPGITALGVNMVSGTKHYVLPPTALGGTTADQIYTVSRTTLSVSSMRLDCDTGSGTANVTLFDNHVLGCHLTTGAACDTTQTSFLDTNRVVYKLTGGATVKTKVITKANPTCADARTAVGFTG